MLSRQRQHVAVRRAAHEDSSDITPRASVHYLASQYLADSSLSADVSQFDFASSVCPLIYISLSLTSLDFVFLVCKYILFVTFTRAAIQLAVA